MAPLDLRPRHPCVESAVLFGSRVKGTARPSSDVDLALAGRVSPRGHEALGGASGCRVHVYCIVRR